MAFGKKFPLRAETIARKSLEQEPVRSSTPEEVAGFLRSEITRLSREIDALSVEFERVETTEAGLKLARSITIRLETQARLMARLDEITGGE